MYKKCILTCALICNYLWMIMFTGIFFLLTIMKISSFFKMILAVIWYRLLSHNHIYYVFICFLKVYLPRGNSKCYDSDIFLLLNICKLRVILDYFAKIVIETLILQQRKHILSVKMNKNVNLPFLFRKLFACLKLSFKIRGQFTVWNNLYTSVLVSKSRLASSASGVKAIHVSESLSNAMKSSPLYPKVVKPFIFSVSSSHSQPVICWITWTPGRETNRDPYFQLNLFLSVEKHLIT